MGPVSLWTYDRTCLGVKPIDLYIYIYIYIILWIQFGIQNGKVMLTMISMWDLLLVLCLEHEGH